MEPHLCFTKTRMTTEAMVVTRWWLLLNAILPLVVLAIPGDPDKQAYCVSLAGKGDCNFYDDCIEKWTQTCGSSGYALGYGGKYCRKFADKIQLFNNAGQQWVDEVRLCLQDKLIHSSVYADNSSCNQISSFSYHTHSYCYVTNGFCNVILMDKQNLNALFNTVSVKDLMWPVEATKAICDTLKLCNELETSQEYQNNVTDEGRIIQGFLTWVAQLAADYPILSNLACGLYQ